MSERVFDIQKNLDAEARDDDYNQIELDVITKVIHTTYLVYQNFIDETLSFNHKFK